MGGRGSSGLSQLRRARDAFNERLDLMIEFGQDSVSIGNIRDGEVAAVAKSLIESGRVKRIMREPEIERLDSAFRSVGQNRISARDSMLDSIKRGIWNEPLAVSTKQWRAARDRVSVEMDALLSKGYTEDEILAASTLSGMKLYI